jgi:protein-disulfide isomerase
MATLPAEEAHAIRIIIRHKPLLFHTWAREAATVSICVDSQDPDAFWKLHDFVFAQQNELTAENVKPRLLQFVTEELHIDRRAVNACLESHGYEDTLARDHQLVEQFNIRETPTVFVNGRRYVGLKSAEDLKLAIDAALGAARQVSEPASTPPK